MSGRITDLIRDQPYLRAVLPEPGTIDRLGDTNRALLIDKLSYGLTDFTTWVVQGFIVLVLVIFLLIESEMLTAKLVRFFAQTPDRGPRRRRGAHADHAQDPRLPDCPDPAQRRPGDRDRAGALGPERPFCVHPGAGGGADEFRPLHRPDDRWRAAHPDRPGTDRLDRRRPDRGGDVPGRRSGSRSTWSRRWSWADRST